MPTDDLLKSIITELDIKEKKEDEEEDEELEEEVSPDDEETDLEDDEEILEDDEDDEEEEEEEPVKPAVKKPDGTEEFKSKPTKEDKEKYAFEQLRKKAKETEDQVKQLDEVAHAYGFSSSKEMVEKLQKDALAKQAKEQGVDPKFYADLQETKKQLEALRSERQQEQERTKINAVVSKIDAFAKDNGLNEAEKEELISNLDEDGFTIETLANLKNHNKVFTGYMKEKILAKEQQKLLEKEEKKKRLKEDKISNPAGGEGKLSLDKIVDEMLKRGRQIY